MPQPAPRARFSVLTVSLVKALRRSIKGEKDSSKMSIGPKAATAIVPPKKVIRALYDYEAQSDQELGFSRGDFFHVIGREDDPDWYEACNPALPDARGLVPAAFFQALGRTERDSAQSDGGNPPLTPAAKNPDHDSGYAEAAAAAVGRPGSDNAPHGPISPPSAPMHNGQPMPIGGPQGAPQGLQGPQGANASERNSRYGKNGAMVYGIVMYDFKAERADELEAKAGEAIIVIAQSNPEWFVAKPIGRLGGPGLIPVSFIEIRDMVNDRAVENPSDAIKKAGVPKVEEWKKMAAEYKNSSITLGKFEGAGPPQGAEQNLEQGVERMSLQQQSQQQQQKPDYRMSAQNNSNYRQPSQQSQPRSSQQASQSPYSAQPSPATQMYAPVSTRIPRYCFAEDKYWFVIEAQLEDGRWWELSRYYEDFYDFQIALLKTFPAEAGNTGEQKRSLPYMPGPVNYVTDAITEGRLHNLDAYVKNLLAQPPYIARCILVRRFFAPREGDYEIDPNMVGEEYRLSGGSQLSSTDSPAEGGASRQSSRNNLNGGGYGGAPQQRPSYDPTNAVQPVVARQPSSLSQPSQTSLSPGISQPVSAMKVKLCFNGDLIAIRVPTDIQFQQLYEKVRDRLKISAGESIELFYKDEPTGDKPSLMSNNDLNIALQRNEKLLLYVELV